MPSGISHMLLSRHLDVAGGPLEYVLPANIPYFQFGSIAPDLPYGSIADDHFLDSDAPLANLFHFTEEGQDPAKAPNQIPVLGPERIKEIVRTNPDGRESSALFWFLAGYTSHVIADGVFHPYVMDKVGPYEGSNKADHRALEMGIDVLLCKHFTEGSGVSLEASYLGMDTTIKGFNELPYADSIRRHFAGLISEVYGESVSLDEIRGWVTGLSRLICQSTGQWPAWFRRLPGTAPYVFREMGDLVGREEEYLVLRKPKYWDENFRRVPEVHLFKDCLPRFNLLMKAFLEKAYAFAYNPGPEIREGDLPAFSLDTGRTVDDPNNIDLEPLLWRA